MSMSCVMYSNLLKTKLKSHVTSLHIVGRWELYDAFIFFDKLGPIPNRIYIKIRI